MMRNNKSNFHRLLWWSLLPFCMLLACGTPPGGNPSTVPPPYVHIQTQSEALNSVHLLTGFLFGEVQNGPELATTAVFLATQLTQSQTPVKTGTVKQDPKTGQFTYRSTPSDRLVLEYAQRFYSFRIDKLEGNLNGSSRDFLLNDHHLTYTLFGNEETNLFVESKLQKGVLGFACRGKLYHEYWTYSVNVEGVGSVKQIIKPTFSTLLWEVRLTGSVERRDLKLQIDQSHKKEQTTTLSPSQTSTRWQDTYKTKATWEKHSYMWKDCSFDRYYIDGSATEPSKRWKIQGTVDKNQASFGSYKLELDLPVAGFVRLVLVLPEKEIIQVGSWKMKP